MKLLSNVVRSIYSVEKRSSQEQLRDDFGEFPPAPLRGGDLTGQFNVVRTRGIGDTWHDLLTMSQLARAATFDAQALSTDLVAFVGPDTLRALREGRETFGRAAPIVLTVVFGLWFLVRAAKEAWRGPTRPNVLGLFMPLFKDESRIVVKAGRLKNESDAPVISHEHLHLLQYRNPERHSRHVQFPERVLSEFGLRHRFHLYLMEKMEVEARLHECVLSFYRAHRHLPTTVSGFLGLLAANKQFGEAVTLILNCQGVGFDREVAAYSARGEKFADDLTGVFLGFKTDELSCRYLTEVLPVMYGNLLKYYGDNVASHRFLDGMKRPNFYDDLYAASGS